jgi:CMP-N-acetylneuraminic acid synthetase
MISVDESPKIITIIPSKFRSVRLPNKNFLTVNGKPMLCWAIEACKESKYDMEVWVSSDSDEILKIATEAGARTHKRTPELCQDHVFKQAVIRDAVGSICHNRAIKPDIVISLQPNSPEIRGYHIDKGIDALLKYNRSEIFSVDENLMQNGAFRIMKMEYVFQRDLSTYCGVVVCNVTDVHEPSDMKIVNKEDDV